MQKTIIYAFCALGICACASKPVQLANEKDWSEITCSGFKTWHDCRTQALEVCPNGFYTADSLENMLIQRRVVSIACKS
jgi:hypothetical protein